jgi:asparagine synthase (glutamine-hydrolysing)
VLLPSVGDWFLSTHSWGFTGSDLAAIAPDAARLPPEFDDFALQDVPPADQLAQWMRHNEMGGHLQMMLLKVDRASMYHGLELRVPLLDREVVEVASRIAPKACMADGVGKVVLRQHLGDFVPSDRIPTAKKGFTVPMGNWLRGELRPLVHDLLLERDPYPSGLFDRTALRTLYADHVDGRPPRPRTLWGLLSLQLWADAHLRPLPT